MCGIVGYIGPRNAADVIVRGLRTLEYRGYDSAGIALLQRKQIFSERAVGKLGNLERKLQSAGNQSSESGTPIQLGMGHTRWATHGGVTERNAHPHISANGRVAVVHNGIVENFIELKHQLQAEGVQFQSETDTEVIAQLMGRYLGGGMDFERAAHETIAQLRGSQAIVLLSPDAPDMLITARIGNAGGVVIGQGDGEMFMASDAPGIIEFTRKIMFLDSHELAVIRRENFTVNKIKGGQVDKRMANIPWDLVSAEKGEYRHFMQKEMYEQARAITDTIRGRVNFETGEVQLPELNITHVPDRIYTTASGTSLHSAWVGRFMLEGIAGVPTEVDYGSEFRYRNPLLVPNSVVMGITQSGETADTLAAMACGRERGSTVWSIVNAIGSQAERNSDGHIAMRTGPEIGVCSTKTFIASIVDQYLLACMLGQMKGRAECRALALDVMHLPSLISKLLEPNPVYAELVNAYHDREHFLFLGRGINYPIALEGALKLKEESYIHAEGYPAGEMKHGPIALIDEKMPVVCIATQDAVYEKMVSQVEQVRARHGKVIAIATEGDTIIADKADHVIYIPKCPPWLTPVLTTIPMQRLAYDIAVFLGCDVDQPRNLAKSVTVE